MKEKYLIGIDMGVTLVKVGIYDINGSCINMVTDKSPADLPGPGIFVQSGEDFFRIVINTLKDSMEKSGMFKEMYKNKREVQYRQYKDFSVQVGKKS